MWSLSFSPSPKIGSWCPHSMRKEKAFLTRYAWTAPSTLPTQSLRHAGPFLASAIILDLGRGTPLNLSCVTRPLAGEQEYPNTTGKSFRRLPLALVAHRITDGLKITQVSMKGRFKIAALTPAVISEVFPRRVRFHPHSVPSPLGKKKKKKKTQKEPEGVSKGEMVLDTP